MADHLPRLASLIELPVIADPRGKLCFAESERHVPFAIERVYYLYDVPAGAVRAGHAHHLRKRCTGITRRAGSKDPAS